MKYRVLVAGVPIECESMEDAIALARAAGGATDTKPSRPQGANGTSNTRWTEARMTEFLGILKGDQRKLVDELIEHPEGRTDAQLLTELGMKDGRALAGVFTSVWKNARKVGADPSDVYVRQRVTIADRRGYEYTLSESFRRVAEKVRATIKK